MTQPPNLTAGIDEAGRGPLAGSVIAAAVILPPQYNLNGLTDSKKISAKKRNDLSQQIKQQAIAWAIGEASVSEIDTLNIHHASLLAMQRACQALPIQPNNALIDGKFCPQLSCPSQAIIQGDSREPAISAASIIAKVTRDAQMAKWHETYPQYGFAQHAGYGTKQHLQALADHGACAIHRRSFKPIKNLGENND